LARKSGTGHRVGTTEFHWRWIFTHYGSLRRELDPTQTVSLHLYKTIQVVTLSEAALLHTSDLYFSTLLWHFLCRGQEPVNVHLCRSLPERGWQTASRAPLFQIRKNNAYITHADVRSFISCPSPPVVDSLAPSSFMHTRANALAIPMNNSPVHGPLVEPVSRKERA
jgi:hypothetical protein